MGSRPMTMDYADYLAIKAKWEADIEQLRAENERLRQQVDAVIRRDSIEADTVSDEFIWSWEQLDDAVGEWKAVGDTVEG